MCDNMLRLAKPNQVYYGKVYPDGLEVPCGKCVKCLNRRVNDWVFRLQKEYKRSISAWFVTLTYDRENVPMTKNGFMTLSKEHITTFMDTLRDVNLNKVKFYMAAEYGSKNRRPHYHYILFNMDYADDMNVVWNQMKVTRKLQRVWNKGNVDVGHVTNDSIAYCCKYVDKDKKAGTYRRDDRLKEFSRMSRGLGENYLTDETIKFLKTNIGTTITNDAGYSIALPRYYRKKIYKTEEEQRMYQDAARRRVEEAYNKRHDRLSHKLYGYDRLDLDYDEKKNRALWHEKTKRERDVTN